MAAATPTAERIRETAREVVARRMFRLESEGQSDQEIPLYIRLILKIFRWLQETFASLFDVSPLLAWTIVSLMVIILAAILVQMFFFFKSLFARERTGPSFQAGEKARIDPQTWENRALEAANSGQYLAAVRELFRASVAQLEASQGKPFRRGMTGREMTRRYSGTPVHEPISRIVRTLEQTWYGFEPCAEGDYRLVSDAYLVLKQHIRAPRTERPHAHRP